MKYHLKIWWEKKISHVLQTITHRQMNHESPELGSNVRDEPNDRRCSRPFEQSHIENQKDITIYISFRAISPPL